MSSKDTSVFDIDVQFLPPPPTPPHSPPQLPLTPHPLTSIVVVVIDHPENDSENFKDVKWMQHFLNQ